MFTKGGAGYLTWTKYDPGTGAVLKTINDADTSISTDFTGGTSPSAFSGLSSVAGSHLRLTTSYTADNVGQTTSVVSPNGNPTYFTYDDANHEMTCPTAATGILAAGRS